MDRVAELTEIVQREVEGYAGPVLEGKSYVVYNPNQHIFTVIDVPDHFPRKFEAGIAVMARIVGDKVVIEEDIHDRPLVNELVRAGIPREQIICTYIGEKLPEESS
jgi:XisI protein